MSLVLHAQLPASANSGALPYPFNIGCIADLGQTFNSSTTLANLLVRALTCNPDPDPALHIWPVPGWVSSQGTSE